MYALVREFRTTWNISTVPLMRFLYSAVFSKNQNARKSGKRCDKKRKTCWKFCRCQCSTLLADHFGNLWIIDRPGHTKNSLVVNFSIHSGLYFLSHKSFNPYLVILNYYLLVYSCTQKWERKRMEGSRTPPCLFSWPPSCGIVSIDLWFPRHNTK